MKQESPALAWFNSFKDDRYHVWNLDRASRRFAPASTFKISNH
jgi:beta-lactamase class D